MVTSDVALRAGDELGRFQLLVPIGAGGMGRVWVAREASTGRLFAIKTTLSDEQAGGEFWNVLLDEARIAAQIQHRGICAIHAFEVDEQRGVPYLVMDFSDGGSLHELLEAIPEHRIEPVLAASIVALLCDGLQAAHELTDEVGALLGVVHRDVSPQNVLISTRGDVQLTDFGVAKARGRLHAATATGELKGKLSYMAPEQVTTGEVDRRADVFALGCVLYEATVGVRPFHGDDALATLYQLLEKPLVLPSARLAGYPPGLESIVVKALQRSAAERYPSAEQMGRALSVWIAGQGRIVTEKQIAALVREHLGTRIAERTRRITSAEVELDSAPAPASTEHTLEGASSTTFSAAPVQRARLSTLKWALLAGGACAAFALLFLLFSRQKPVANAAQLASDRQAPLPPPLQLASQATLMLRAEPAFASLFLDEGSVLPNPFRMNVPRDGSTHRVRAVAAGFNERVEDVRFDDDQEIVLALVPLSSGTQAHTASTKVGPSTNASPRPPVVTGSNTHSNAATAESASVPASSATRRPIGKKPPRTLDSNPFESPPPAPGSSR